MTIALPQYLQQEHINAQVSLALEEDIQTGDITALLIDKAKTDTATIITREPMVMCGQAWAQAAFRALDPSMIIHWQVTDGERVQANQELCKIQGQSRAILSAERTALNFLQTLCGTATTAAEYAKLAVGSNIKLLDTRKTLPNLRYAQKYAVLCGGCHNHRLGLYDAFLIKENHILACGSVTKAISQARKIDANKTVEIEVESLEELQEAFDAKADIVMLDNFTQDMLESMQSLSRGRTKIEYSGNVELNQIHVLANYQIDYISIGALTKHCQAIDLSLRLTNT